jgi:RNA recognition motif. (a.k.a. RRM, RBD, or RNP domain)
VGMVFRLPWRWIRCHSISPRGLDCASVRLPGAGDIDPSNTTLFIGGLSAGVTEDSLRAVFQRFGDIVYVKIPPGKGCGFVQFLGRANAEHAMAQMNGQVCAAVQVLRLGFRVQALRVCRSTDGAYAADGCQLGKDRQTGLRESVCLGGGGKPNR